MSQRLIEEREAHIVVGSRFVATVCLFFLFFSGSGFLRRRCSGSSSTASRGSCHGRRRRSQVTQERSDVHAVQGLSEERGPVGLDRNASSFQKGGDLVGGDGDAVIVKDQ